MFVRREDEQLLHCILRKLNLPRGTSEEAIDLRLPERAPEEPNHIFRAFRSFVNQAQHRDVSIGHCIRLAVVDHRLAQSSFASRGQEPNRLGGSCASFRRSYTVSVIVSKSRANSLPTLPALTTSYGTRPECPRVLRLERGASSLHGSRDKFSQWSRTRGSEFILLDKKPVRAIPKQASIDELYPLPRSETDYSIARPKKLVGWETFFYAGDAVLRQLERLPWKPTRGQAIRRAERWILEHQEADGSWGGIQPPWVYSLMALSCLGYGPEHPVISKGLSGFDNFAIEEQETMRIQACVSPLWDTGLAMNALADSGMRPDHPALVKAGMWLLERQNLNGGDWQVRAKGVRAGGWAFEFNNDGYPDLDDTSEIVMALSKVALPADSGKDKAIQRALSWTLGMQCENGGWAAFDKNNTKTLIARIPFADFGETIDPPSVDVTAHILEMLGQLGYDVAHPSVARALDYVLSEQGHDGPWFGRWGVNYIYGTGAVLPAFEAFGIEMSSDVVRRAVKWVFEHQNADGGWGESCSSYVDPSYRGRGPSTPSQTAWALLALLSAGEGGHEASRRGVAHLVETQRQDGSWDEPYFTGTGFPGYRVGQRLDNYLGPDDPRYQGRELPAGFMIAYHMYRNYWPLIALGRYRSSAQLAGSSSARGVARGASQLNGSAISARRG